MTSVRRLIPESAKPVLRPLYRRIFGAPSAQGTRPPELPSDDEKHATILEYAHRYACRTLVETGTFEGDTIAAVKDDFDNVYSIELNPELHRRAQRRFRRSPHVHLVEGDSSEELERLLPQLRDPTLFWLDAHYSRGGAPSSKGKYDPPLMFELGAILALREPRHVVLIDDARCCGVEPGWPTFAELEHVVRESRLGLAVELRRDIVRIHGA